MIIDFHAHAFPIALASRTVQMLAAQANIPHYSDGTTEGLCRELASAGVDAAVVLPVMTKPHHFDSLNKFAAEINSGKHDACGVRLFSFGGMFPDGEDAKSRVRLLKSMGLKGIKLHPDYQQTFIDDVKYLRIIDAALSEDMTVSIHAGLDVGYPDCVHCPPKRALAMLKSTGGGKVVLAHMGGFDMWQEVADVLVGQNVYFDTGVVAKSMDRRLATDIVKAHGANKVLYATDSPWESQQASIDFVNGLDITQQEKTMIFGLNAAKLLDLGE